MMCVAVVAMALTSRCDAHPLAFVDAFPASAPLVPSTMARILTSFHPRRRQAGDSSRTTAAAELATGGRLPALRMASSPPPFPDTNDPYDLLGLSSRSVSSKELKRAYKQMTSWYHPDAVVSPDSSAAEKKRASDNFARIIAAYEALRTQTGSGAAKGRNYAHPPPSSSKAPTWADREESSYSRVPSPNAQWAQRQSPSDDFSDYVANFDRTAAREYYAAGEPNNGHTADEFAQPSSWVEYMSNFDSAAAKEYDTRGAPNNGWSEYLDQIGSPSDDDDKATDGNGSAPHPFFATAKYTEPPAWGDYAPNYGNTEDKDVSKHDAKSAPNYGTAAERDVRDNIDDKDDDTNGPNGGSVASENDVETRAELKREVRILRASLEEATNHIIKLKSEKDGLKKSMENAHRAHVGQMSGLQANVEAAWTLRMEEAREKMQSAYDIKRRELEREMSTLRASLSDAQHRIVTLEAEQTQRVEESRSESISNIDELRTKLKGEVRAEFQFAFEQEKAALEREVNFLRASLAESNLHAALSSEQIAFDLDHSLEVGVDQLARRAELLQRLKEARSESQSVHREIRQEAELTQRPKETHTESQSAQRPEPTTTLQPGPDLWWNMPQHG